MTKARAQLLLDKATVLAAAAHAKLARAEREFEKDAASADEVENARTAYQLATIDLQLARLDLEECDAAPE